MTNGSPYPDWPAYQHILAERFGFVMRREPDESWWTWRGHRIHIDTHRPQIPERGTLILVHGAGGQRHLRRHATRVQPEGTTRFEFHFSDFNQATNFEHGTEL